MADINFDKAQPPALTPEEISKRINQSIKLAGLTSEEWSWMFSKLAVYLILMIFASIVLTVIGLDQLGQSLQLYGLMFTPVLFFFLIKLLRRITKIYGENTAFLVLAQHSAIEIFFTNILKNRTFTPEPSGSYSKLEG